jgi:P27 family predicted phage terminase small subunit
MSNRRPKPPRHLDPDAQAKWKEIVAHLPDQEQGTLDALAAYCQAWSRMVAAEARVAELGAVVKSPQGFPAVNPYLSVLQQERRAVRQWAAELKLTPKSRSTRRRSEEPQDPVLRLIAEGHNT